MTKTPPGITRSRSLLSAFLLGPVLLGCGEAPSGAPPTALLTLSALRAAYDVAPDTPVGPGLSAVFKGGFPPSYFLGAPDQVRIAPAYTEGQQTAYITTDIWVNFPVVWSQALYVFVSVWNPQAPELGRLPIPPVMAVGEKSAFWTPFWRVYYVQVPADTPTDRYRTVRDVLATDPPLPMFRGPSAVLSLTPPGGMVPTDPATLVLPELRSADKVGLPPLRTVWVDGQDQPRQALDFGIDRFEQNSEYEILDQPLFFFFTLGADGTWQPLLDIPRVGGTGPQFENRPPIAPGNHPLYGSFWRLWAVFLPAGAKVFVPPHRVAEWQAVVGAKTALPIATFPQGAAAASLAPAEMDAHAFKVLLDETCLAGATDAASLAACPFLDSQTQLERLLPSALFPSEVLVACPFVSHAGAPVPPPP